MTTEKLTKSRRLDILSELLSDIACSIRNAQQELADEDCSANRIQLVADVLGRLGWLAGQGCVVANDVFYPVVGDAHAWMLRPALLERIGKNMPARMRGSQAK